jgi:hypothetical protein
MRWHRILRGLKERPSCLQPLRAALFDSMTAGSCVRDPTKAFAPSSCSRAASASTSMPALFNAGPRMLGENGLTDVAVRRKRPANPAVIGKGPRAVSSGNADSGGMAAIHPWRGALNASDLPVRRGSALVIGPPAAAPTLGCECSPASVDRNETDRRRFADHFPARDA